MVTLHVLAHQHTDLSWVKHCESPKIRVGKALTAPQVLMLIYIAIALIGFVVCCCCILRGDGAKDDDVYGSPPGAGSIELGNRAKPEVVGNSQPLEGVTYH